MSVAAACQRRSAGPICLHANEVRSERRQKTVSSATWVGWLWPMTNRPLAGAPTKLAIKTVGLMLSGDLEKPILNPDAIVAVDGRITAIRPRFSRRCRDHAERAYRCRSRKPRLSLVRAILLVYGINLRLPSGGMGVVAVEPEKAGWAARSSEVLSTRASGPFAQARLDEALGLAVSLRGVRPGTEMLDPEPAQRLGVAAGARARAVVGHDALDLDAQASKETQGVEEKAQAGGADLVGGKDLRIGEARMVVDRQESRLPSRPRGCCSGQSGRR